MSQGTIIGLAFCGLAGPLAMLAQAPPPVSNAPVLIISSDPAAHVSAAGGKLIGPTTTLFAVLAFGDPGFIERIDASGVWYIADGRWIAKICGYIQS